MTKGFPLKASHPVHEILLNKEIITFRLLFNRHAIHGGNKIFLLQSFELCFLPELQQHSEILGLKTPDSRSHCHSESIKGSGKIRIGGEFLGSAEALFAMDQTGGICVAVLRKNSPSWVLCMLMRTPPWYS